VAQRRTLLAAMANYIDAGSIVAGAVALPIWAEHFGFGSSFVSFLGAFSSNAIAAGLGALIGGRICDLLGRKKTYQWDLLLYAFGTLWIVFAFEPWMLLVGFFIVGLTVGADVPASWTLITETAPSERRGRFAGLAQVLWYVGAIAPLLFGLVLLDLEMLATRIIFAHLLIVALITWALRQGMTESSLSEEARGKEADSSAQAIRELLSRRFARSLLFLIVMYGVWNLVAGTYGLFFPFILDAVGSTTDRANLALQAIWFVSTALAVAFVYMPLIDQVSRRAMLIWSSCCSSRRSCRSSSSTSRSSPR
jgi:inositol transporter-like SP family MFS transporter